MNIVIDHKSVVTIGGFNPTILTPDFLRKSCGFSSHHNPKGQTTPVASEIRFGNSHFLMELNKFQITTLKPSSFKDVFPLDVAKKYLDVLEYTPVSLFGINLNYSVSEINIASLQAFLKDPWSLGENLNVEPTSVILKAKKPNGEGLSLREVEVAYMADANIKNNVRFSFESGKITINNNFEVGHLDEDRKRLSILLDRHDDLLKMNDRLMGAVDEACK